MSITDRISAFKTDLQGNVISAEEIFKKHLIDCPTYFFSEVQKKTGSENKLISLIATTFHVNNKEVFIVGSGKTGFSMKPKNLFNTFDHAYKQTTLNKDKSDLDIVIVSSALFDSIGNSMYRYTAAYSNKWETNKYYSQESIKSFNVPICYKCFEYYTKGWFRPDYKPDGFEFCKNGSLENLKTDIYKIIKRKGTIAVFKNWFYFSNYHIKNIKNLSFITRETKL